MRRLPLEIGRVRLAVATTADGHEDCLAQGRAAAAAGAEVVELRADLLEELEPLERVAGLAARLRLAGGVPLLLTLRSAAEGGGARLDDVGYRAVLSRLIGLLGAGADGGSADAVDIELARGATAELVAEAHEAGLDAVVSSHDLEATPSQEEMLARLHDMARCGADAVKLAVTPGGPEDVLRLLSATVRAGRELEVPVITMSMGELGAVSRVSGGVFGSAMTFVTAGDRASAPGQPPLAPAREAIALLSPHALP